MEGYGYGYAPPPFDVMPSSGMFPDRGDGFGDYYPVGPTVDEHNLRAGPSNTKTKALRRDSRHSVSRSVSDSRSRSRTRSKSRSKSRSRSRSRSRSKSRKSLKLREPSILDAFRVLYLTPSGHKKTSAKFLETKKRLDHVQELLKTDGLGSKRWLFYPRKSRQTCIDDTEGQSVPGERDNCDQRIKIDDNFFRKCKKGKIDPDSPVAKLKRWELILYKKLGFIQAV